MCGLVGCVGDMWQADKKIFNFMLQLDTVRGKHSTGVARIPNQQHERKNVQIVKDVGTPYDLMDNMPDEFWNRKTGHGELAGDFAVLMGHNRWATVGKINPDNAHPFEAGNIIGAQNGTLPDFWRKKLDDHEFYDTDTEALMFNIDLHGVENVLPKISGAWALTWYNREEDTFNIIRNKERPLYFAWKKNGKVMYYASEPWMIYAAADKYGVDLENELCYSFPTDTLYSFKLGSMTTFNKERITKTTIKGWEAPPQEKKDNTTYSATYGERWGNKSAKESANVFNTTTKLIAPPLSKYEDWAGKKDIFFEFEMTGDVMEDEQRKEFFEAYTIKDRAPIRIYPSHNHPDLEARLGDTDVSTFAAKIKGVKSIGKTGMFYLKIDLDTIMVATFKPSYYKKGDSHFNDLFDDDDFVVMIANGKTIDRAEWDKRVSNGCSWCNDQPKASECSAIHWLSDSDFLCVDCSKPGSDASQYVPELTKLVM